MNLASRVADALRSQVPFDERIGAPTLSRILDMLATDIGEQPLVAAPALARFEELARVNGASELAARSLYLRARAEWASGDLAAAMTLIDSSARAFDELGLPGAALRTNLGKAHILNETGRHTEALEACDQILKATMGDPPVDLDSDETLALRAFAEQNRGLCFELTSDWDRALEAYSRAEALYARIDDGESIGEILNNRGQVLLATGRIGDARLAFTEAISLLTAAEAFASAVVAMNGLSYTLLALGDYVRCLDTLASAGELLAGLDTPLTRHDHVLTKARAYEALNLHQEALATYIEVAEFYGRTGLAVDGARSRWGAARVRLRLGHLAEAEADLAEVAASLAVSGHRQWLAVALLDRAEAQQRLGELDAARQLIDQAIVLSRAADARIEEVRSELALAGLLDRQTPGSVDARAAIERAGAVAADLDLAPANLAVHHARGMHSLLIGDRDRARPELEQAAAIIERLHTGLGDAIIGRRFTLDKLDVFDALVDLADDLGDDGGGAQHRQVGEVDDQHRQVGGGDQLSDRVESARGRAVLAATERARQRRLGELVLGDRRGGLPSTIVDEGRELDAVYSELLHPQRSDEAYHRALRSRASELELRLSRLRLEHARASDGIGAEVRRDPTLLPDQQIAVSWYCVGDQVGGTVVSEGDVRHRSGIASLTEITELLDRLEAQWHHLHADAAMAVRHEQRFERACREVLAQLYDRLFAPLADLLPPPGDTVVALVAALHGPLHRVPVHALHDGQRYLIERYEVSTTPSLTDYVGRSELKPPSGGALVIAVPDAVTPFIIDEAHAVASRLGQVALHCGDTATAATFLRLAPGASTIHLACHALFRTDNPLFSSLRLADRWLRADELLGLDLRGSLVTLSACDSGRSYDGHGEELTGLTRAVLGAGARTLLASLWPADDAATRQLMSTFYDHLTTQGVTRSLRLAQLDILAEHPHPYYWAPFVVIGGR